MGVKNNADFLDFLILDKEKGSMRLITIVVFFILAGVSLFLTIRGFLTGEKTKVIKRNYSHRSPRYVATGPFVYLSCTFVLFVCALFGVYSRFKPIA
jgi:hypothetical protein